MVVPQSVQRCCYVVSLARGTHGRCNETAYGSSMGPHGALRRAARPRVRATPPSSLLSENVGAEHSSACSLWSPHPLPMSAPLRCIDVKKRSLDGKHTMRAKYGMNTDHLHSPLVVDEQKHVSSFCSCFPSPRGSDFVSRRRNVYLHSPGGIIFARPCKRAASLVPPGPRSPFEEAPKWDVLY